MGSVRYAGAALVLGLIWLLIAVVANASGVSLLFALLAALWLAVAAVAAIDVLGHGAQQAYRPRHAPMPPRRYTRGSAPLGG